MLHHEEKDMFIFAYLSVTLISFYEILNSLFVGQKMYTVYL